MRHHINFKTTLGTIIVLMMMLFPTAQNAYSAGQNASLSSLDVSSEGTLVRISLDGAIKTRTFHLDGPPRWVMDISPATWSKDIERIIFPENDKYFGQVRTGQWKANTARLVIHTRGMYPEVDVNDDEILILFENQSGSVVANEALPKLSPPEKVENKPASSLSIEPLGKPKSTSSTKKDSGHKVVQIPKVESEKTAASSIMQVKSASIQNTQNENRKISSGDTIEKSPEFQILSDGAMTIIHIPLTGDMSFDIRRDRYPDRLTIEYPSRKNISGTMKVKYTSLGKENMPVGIVEYCQRFVSRTVPDYYKLVFYTGSKYQYKSMIQKGILTIEVRSKDFSSRNLGLETAKASAVEVEKTELQLSEQVNLLENDNPEVTTNPEATTVSVDQTKESLETTKSAFEGDTQTFTPPEQKYSFIIDKPQQVDGTEHTVPEASLKTRINKVEAIGDVRQASVREMTKFLPEFADSSLIKGSESLKTNKTNKETDENLVSGGPMMFEPSMESKPLPKGTRPAADLFLSKGESVILPTTTLIRASVGDPEVLVVNVLSQNELLITAKAKGRTSLILWEDGIGRSVRWVNVGKSSLLETIDVERVINNPKIKVNFVGEKTIVLEGKVQTEEEMNRAVKIAAGAVESVDNVVNLIEMTDPKQVLVKVRFVEIQTKNKDEFFKQFGTGTRTEKGDFQFNILTDIIDPEFGSGGIFDTSLHPSILKGDGSGDMRFDAIDLVLSYLEQSRCGRILSQPNLVTLSGHPAEFRVGGEIPYTYQNENGFNVVDFREFGVELKMVPNVDSDNNINIFLEPSVRVPDFTLAIAGIPGFKTRLVSTTIQVGDSQTIVIGGLLQNEHTTIKSKVPLLGDVPLLGELFRSKKTTNEETELLIFLTPVVVKNVSAVEQAITSDDDVSLSPYYQKEAVEGFKED
ncbi:pilus assembly protein N-terminal domain-containing protein [bacterium]|nr:pilus assembly protein N-terminal domain-containing protein [bacterium]